jgi:hypothetical protein
MKPQIILYIPSWEETQSFVEQEPYYTTLAKKYPLTIIFDGIQGVHTDLNHHQQPKQNGLIPSLRRLSLSAHTITILRLGVFPTHEELELTYTQIQEYDAIYTGLDYAKDGFITMNRKSYQLFLSSEPRLYSIGYGIAAHALWEQNALSSSPIQIEKYSPQIPDAHRKQICSNILHAWLKAKKLNFFAQRNPPLWFSPIEETISIITHTPL